MVMAGAQGYKCGLVDMATGQISRRTLRDNGLHIASFPRAVPV